jgi:hypothetical protein
VRKIVRKCSQRTHTQLGPLDVYHLRSTAKRLRQDFQPILPCCCSLARCKNVHFLHFEPLLDVVTTAVTVRAVFFAQQPIALATQPMPPMT